MVAESGVAEVEVEVIVKGMGYFLAGFFAGVDGGATGQQVVLERAPTGFGLGRTR